MSQIEKAVDVGSFGDQPKRRPSAVESVDPIAEAPTAEVLSIVDKIRRRSVDASKTGQCKDAGDRKILVADEYDPDEALPRSEPDSAEEVGLEDRTAAPAVESEEPLPTPPASTFDDIVSGVYTVDLPPTTWLEHHDAPSPVLLVPQPAVHPHPAPSRPVVAPEPVVAPQPVAARQPIAASQPAVASQPIAAPRPVVAPQPVAAPQLVVAPQPVAAPQAVPTRIDLRTARPAPAAVDEEDANTRSGAIFLLACGVALVVLPVLLYLIQT